MVYQGTVENGVVVFEGDVKPPEGAPVRVELVKQNSEEQSLTPEEWDLSRMAELAVDTGIPDLGVNVDHYLYGHPKQVEIDDK